MSKGYKALNGLKENELKSKLVELKKELIKIRGQAATGTSQRNPYEIRNTRKTIARIHTALQAQKSAVQQPVKQKEGETKA